MHCFSISAPICTVEEHQQELELLSKEERREIEENVTGTARFIETPSMKEAGLVEFQHELDLIPTEQKEAYLEAVRRCPLLVETETSPVKFLRCEHYNAKSAALRMVRNWDMRRAAFGEKAFEPMTIDGALSEDVVTLKTGFFQLLQEGNEKERAIILFDRPKLTHNIYNRDSAVRYVWLLWSCRLFCERIAHPQHPQRIT